MIVNVTSQRELSLGTAYLVDEQPNPSTDYFVLPVIAENGLRVIRCRFDDLPAPAEMKDAVVIFVRYVPSAWMKLVDAVRPMLRSLVYFMDDDILETGMSAGMPWRYRFKLARLAAWRAGWLRKHGAELWVSTHFLLQKYSEWKPRLILPSPAMNPINSCRLFYHGTASHEAEIRWLYPVLDEVLRQGECLSLEIIGGSDVYRLYRGVPRVTVIHPMKWPAYQAFLAIPGRHIGLAPLLDLPFNRGRSYTKFFDITRCGAVGIFSPNSVYSEIVKHGESGLIVELHQEAWVKAILSIARDEPLRHSLLLNAQAKSAELVSVAQRDHIGLMQTQAEKNQ